MTSLKTIYFAGKVDSYRAELFKCEAVMESDAGSLVRTAVGGECFYGGPTAFTRAKVAPDHSWENKAHGIVGTDGYLPDDSYNEDRDAAAYALVSKADQETYFHFAGWELPANTIADTISNDGSGGISQTGAVRRCFEQIDRADAVHAYIDTLECPGTLAELGYASAKGIEIHLVISPSLQPKQVFEWYPISGNCGCGPCDSLLEASNQMCGLETPMKTNGDQFLYYINNEPRWMTMKEFREWATDQHSKGYPDVKSVSSEPKSSGHFYGFSIDRIIRNADRYSGDEYGQHSFSEREIIHEYKFERPEKDELWFIKNLPGVKSCRYGGPTDINPDLLLFPPKPEPKPEPPKGEKAAPVSPKMRFEVLVRDGYRCQACGAAAADGATLEVDHIVPRARGGQNVLWNLQTLCFDCNRGKRDKIVPPPPAA